MIINTRINEKQQKMKNVCEELSTYRKFSRKLGELWFLSN